jgi:hypothetical protein
MALAAVIRKASASRGWYRKTVTEGRLEMPVKTFGSNEPLTDAELDRLGSFLKGCKGGKAMNIEALDGFFAPSSRDRRP